MKKTTINKSIPDGCTKVTFYTYLINYLCDIADSQNANKIFVSGDVVPILMFCQMNRKPVSEIFGEYVFGEYRNIEFIVTPFLNTNCAKIGEIEIILMLKQEA